MIWMVRTAGLNVRSRKTRTHPFDPYRLLDFLHNGRSRSYSIILSALITSACGILKPIALPVLRLMRNSNLVLLDGQGSRVSTLKYFVHQRFCCRVHRFADRRDSSRKTFLLSARDRNVGLPARSVPVSTAPGAGAKRLRGAMLRV